MLRERVCFHAGFQPAAGGVRPLSLQRSGSSLGGQRSAALAPAEADSGPAPSVPQDEEVVEAPAEELQPLRVIKGPSQPSAAEIEEHEASGHVVYRSWCPICQAARSTGQPHREAPEEDETAVPGILWDYGFLGNDDGKSMPILVLKDRRTKRIAASFVQAKGLDPYAIKFGSSFLISTGYRSIVNKSDGEHAIVSLKARCAQEQCVEAVPQEPGPGDRQGNGEIECAVRELKRQIRAGKYALEAKLGQQLKDDDPVLAWLPRHAGDLICRYRRGLDGKTPEQRRTGKQWRKPALQFGERVFFREARADPGSRLSTLAPVMEEGRYIGHHGRTGVLLVMTKNGVKRGLSFRRLPPEQRWVTEGWSELRGFPWDIKSRVRSMRVPAVGDAEARQPVLQPAMAPPEGPRHLYVLARDVEHFDPTPGCPGCESVVAVGHTVAGRGHTEACRARFAGLLAQDEAGRERLERQRRRERSGASRPSDAGAEGAPGLPEHVGRTMTEVFARTSGVHSASAFASAVVPLAWWRLDSQVAANSSASKSIHCRATSPRRRETAHAATCAGDLPKYVWM